MTGDGVYFEARESFHRRSDCDFIPHERLLAGVEVLPNSENEKMCTLGSFAILIVTVECSPLRLFVNTKVLQDSHLCPIAK
jgi:hypothetical protein